MEPPVQRLQFLDLTEATDRELSLIERVLFTSCQSLEVPWYTEVACTNVNSQEEEWAPPPSYALVPMPSGVYVATAPWLPTGQDEEQPAPEEHMLGPGPGLEGGSEGDCDGDPGARAGEPPPHEDPPRSGPGGLFTGPPTSLGHQLFQMVPSNVFVSNMTANVNVHPPYVAYGHQMQPPPPCPQTPYQPEGEPRGGAGRRQRPKGDKKRDGTYGSPSEVMDTAPAHQYPNIHLPPYYIQQPQLCLPHPAVVPVYHHQLFNPFPPSPAHPMMFHSAPPPAIDEFVEPQAYHQTPDMGMVSEEEMTTRPNGTYQPEEEYRPVPIVVEHECYPLPFTVAAEEVAAPASETTRGVTDHEHICFHTEALLKLPSKKPAASAVKGGEEESTDGREREGKPAEPPSLERKAESDAESEQPVAQVVVQPVAQPVVQQPALPTWASLFSRSDPGDAKSRPLATVHPFTEGDAAVSPSPAQLDAKSPARNGEAAAKLQPRLHSSPDDPHMHRLGEMLLNYDLDHRVVNLQPRGLTNRGNWCYINATLQALIACPPFLNLLRSIKPTPGRRAPPQTRIIDAMVEFVNEFPVLPANARVGKREKSARSKEESGQVEIATGPAFEPSGIYRILDKVRGGSSFSVEGRQEDAEEFLSCLLNGVNDEMFELMKLADCGKSGLSNGDTNGSAEQPGEHHGADGGEEGEDGEAEWTVMGPRNRGSVTRRAVCGKTPVSDIFRGQLRSRVQRAGDQSTDSVQPFFTLQLDIEKANSVKEALDILVGKDSLEGVTCSRTHQQVEAWTQSTLEDLPLVLILHLKCFDYKADGGCSKIMKNVQVAVDLKIDNKLMSMSTNKYLGKQRNYKLVAVVYHDGKEATKGHYITDAYHIGYGCWIRYDDGAVRPISETLVMNPHSPRVPYLLYYRRADTIGPK